MFNQVEANNNGGHGILVDGTNSAVANKVNATASESVAAGNGGTGFIAGSISAPTSFTVSHSVAANNRIGVEATGSAGILRLANSTVTGNTASWIATFNGVLDSYGDNYIDGNGDSSPTPPSIPRK